MVLSHAELAFDVGYWCVAFVLLNAAIYIVSPFVFATWKSLDDKKKEKEWWCASAASSIHAAYVSYLAFVTFFSSNEFEELRTDLYQESPTMVKVGSLFLGYIIVDLAWTFYAWNAWPGSVANLVHHLCVLGWYWQAIVGVDGKAYAHFYCLSAWTFEATTPFINNRWFLDRCGLKTSIWFKINGMVMVVGWIILRLYVYGWCLMFGPDVFLLADMWRSWSLAAIQVIGYGLQWFWGIKIIKGALKVLGLMGGSSSKSNKAK